MEKDILIVILLTAFSLSMGVVLVLAAALLAAGFTSVAPLVVAFIVTMATSAIVLIRYAEAKPLIP